MGRRGQPEAGQREGGPVAVSERGLAAPQARELGRRPLGGPAAPHSACVGRPRARVRWRPDRPKGAIGRRGVRVERQAAGQEWERPEPVWVGREQEPPGPGRRPPGEPAAPHSACVGPPRARVRWRPDHPKQAIGRRLGRVERQAAGREWERPEPVWAGREQEPPGPRERVGREPPLAPDSFFAAVRPGLWLALRCRRHGREATKPALRKEPRRQPTVFLKSAYGFSMTKSIPMQQLSQVFLEVPVCASGRRRLGRISTEGLADGQRP